MFQQLIKSTLFTGLVFSALTVQANQRTVKLGSISVAGSGCPQDTVSTTTDRATGHFMVVPENFSAIIDNGASVARKSCNFAVSFEGTANRAVRITLPRIKGAVALDQNATAEINYEVFFAGQRGERNVLSFSGTERILERNFDEINHDEELLFACGQSGIIRGNASILVNSGSAGTEVAVANVQKMGIKVDSVPCY